MGALYILRWPTGEFLAIDINRGGSAERTSTIKDAHLFLARDAAEDYAEMHSAFGFTLHELTLSLHLVGITDLP